jgi:hypothetical protein
MNRSLLLGLCLGAAAAATASSLQLPPSPAAETTQQASATRSLDDVRIYENVLRPISDPQPLLSDFPQYVEPVIEHRRFEAPRLVDDPDADLDVRAWRFSYNARGIIEVPNRLRAKETAVIVVHPWAVDDEWG